MKEEVSEFERLLQLNVNDKTEKKGKFTYLSWALAWIEFVKVYPAATYEIVKNTNGLPYFADENGGMVYTKVKAGNLMHEMWLPIMDMQNKSKKVFDMMDVNKTVMRCLVKNLAMFGLGTYIYAGEDLPEGEEQQVKPQPPIQQVPRKINPIEIENLIALVEETNSDIEKMCANYKVNVVGDLTITQYQAAIKVMTAKKGK